MVISLTGLFLSEYYHMTSSVTYSDESEYFCINFYFTVVVFMPSKYRTFSNIANFDDPQFITELSNVSEFSSVKR